MDDDWTNKTCGYTGTKESLGLPDGQDDLSHLHGEPNMHTEFNRILRVSLVMKLDVKQVCLTMK